MNVSKSVARPNVKLHNVVKGAGATSSRRWGMWRNVYVIETQGSFRGSRRKNVAKIHNSQEYDARSNKATSAAHKNAEEVFEHVLTTAESEGLPVVTR